jgi:hypothetical protein
MSFRHAKMLSEDGGYGIGDGDVLKYLRKNG